MTKTGEAFFVADGTYPSVANDGSLLYVTSSPNERNKRLVKIDDEGKLTPIPIVREPQGIMGDTVSLSSDERFALLSYEDRVNLTGSIWRVDLQSGNTWRVTASLRGVVDSDPVWHPKDARQVVFIRKGKLGEKKLMTIHIDDAPSEAVEFLSKAPALPRNVSFAISHDGRYVAYSGPPVEPGIVCIDLDNNKSHLMSPEAKAHEPSISADGRLLSYGSFDTILTQFPSGKSYWPVVPPAANRKLREEAISRGFWGKDENTLVFFYADNYGFFHRVPVGFSEESQMPKFGEFEELFDLRELGFDRMHEPFDPSRDGTWFLAVQPVDSAPSSDSEGNEQKAILIENWFRNAKETSSTTISSN